MTPWLLAMKPSFLSEWAALSPGDAEQVQRKLVLLAENPAPDGKTRQMLQGWDGTLCRLRWGRYRVFYTLSETCLSLVAVRRRGNDTYDEAIEAQELGDGAAAPGEEPSRDAPWHRWLTPRAHTGPTLHYLPAPISREVLDSLRVPAEHHGALLGVETEDALLECPSIPERVRLHVLDALVGRPIAAAARQPDLALERTEDLLRHTRGELPAFPLRLDPEQQRLVAPWAGDADATGPTLLAGGPGTGKSTVALYRARAMIDRLRSAGIERPRVLFATYTPAQARAGEQLLGSLLGADAALVDVRPADSVAHGLGQGAGQGAASKRYDAVVIDDAQDLDPAVLQALAGLCAPERLLLTADEAQAIHRAFRWSDVHERLHVATVTGVLRADHRATPEIHAAARQYLASAPGHASENMSVQPDESTGSGTPRSAAPASSRPAVMPAVRSVADRSSEMALLVRYFPAATRELRVGLGACAVLCPTRGAAQRIAAGLRAAGLAAAFMDAGELDPDAPGIKALALASARGLEFPIVAVAGFGDAPYPDVPDGLDAEALAALEQRERRTLFMAMTRATRALLVLVPAGARSALLGGFDPARWNLGETRPG